MNFLALIILAAVQIAFAKDICESKAAKAKPNCHDYIQSDHGSFTKAQLSSIGESSSVCAKLNAADLGNLESRASAVGSKALIELLPFRCIKQIAEGGNIDPLYKVISDDKKRKNKFLENNHDKICDAQKKFDGTALEDDLKSFCKDKKHEKDIEDLKKQNEKSQKELEEMKKKAESAAAFAQDLAPVAVFVTAIVLGLLV